MEIIILGVIILFIITYRLNAGKNVYKYILNQASGVYNKYVPYSYQSVQAKIKDLGQNWTKKDYMTQSIIFGLSGFGISYLYFYSLLVSIIYGLVAILAVPYIAYLRSKRLFSEFIFEQIQVYTTNVIMEFQITNSFVKALEGVYSSNTLEDPVASDVKMMIDLAYQNGSIDQSLDYMNSKYDFYMTRNMHQLFLQITKEGSKDSEDALENMLNDIDMLVEAVYRDRIDRKNFFKQFIQFGIVLYFLIMLIQYMVGSDSYTKMLDMIPIALLIHAIILINSFFLLRGTKYYNENVGAE